MKKISAAILLLAFECLFIHVSAQDNYLHAYGEVDTAELQLKTCSFSPDAAALCLLKYGTVELSVFPNGNSEVVTVTRMRMKIFNQRGYKYATVEIPFYSDNTIKIKNIQAATYNLEEGGKIIVTSLKKEDIFKDEGPKKSSYRSIKFTFPNVKEGSVIEYQITRRYAGAYDVPSWYFQENIPTLMNLFEVYRPLNSNMKDRVIANNDLQIIHVLDDSQGQDKKRLMDRYLIKNVPAFKREVFMSSSQDYKYRADFLMGRLWIYGEDPWSGANNWLLNLSSFGGAFDAKIPGTNVFIDSVKRLSATSDKVHAVYNYVRQKIKWRHVYYKYARDLSDVWKEGEGSSAEINLSILNLLRKCGVQCFPILYSTRTNGKVDYNFPDLSQFNTVNIAVVNGKKFNLLDGTNPYLSYETPPFNVANRTGLLIDNNYLNRLNIDFDRKLIWDSSFVSASLTREGLLQGNVVKKYFDLAKSIKLQYDEEKDNTDEQDFFSIDQAIKADSSWQTNAHDEILPLAAHTKFHYELPVTNDFYFLDPFIFSNLAKNPFTDSTRKSDIDFGASSASVVQISIALPKGLVAEELCKNKSVYNADSSIVFTYHNEVRNDSLYILSSTEIKRPIFEPKEYADVRKVFQAIYTQLNNQIVFKRKEEH